MTAHFEVQGFLESYRQAFEALDAAAVGEFFAYPCQVTDGGDGVAILAVADREAWAPVLEGLVGVYRVIGVRSVELLELEVFELTPRLKQASVRWRLVDGDGQAVYDFDSSYTLGDFGDGPRITAIAHNEGPRLRAQLQRRRQ